MNFEFTEEQNYIRETIRNFSKNEIAPSSTERDINGEFPEQIIKKLGELGFMGMMVPAEWGGSELDTISYVTAIEEVSKVDASVGVIMSVINSLVCHVLNEWGNDYQKEKYLKNIASGKMIGSFCLSEPEAGSDATQQKTTAERDGDNYILNGIKNWITNGTKSEVYIIQAVTDKSKSYKGISTFIVDRNSKGLEIGKKEDKMGIRSSDTCSLGLNSVKVPKENLLGNEGEGFKIAMDALNGGRIGIAAQALGIAKGAYEAALKYSTERKAFGTEISNFQAIQFKLAEMATNIEAAELLTYKAAYKKDRNLKYAKDSAMAKLFASKIAVETTLEAIQIHGGYGYVREYSVERYLRDAKVTEIYEGTSEIQKIIISREILKNFIN